MRHLPFLLLLSAALINGALSDAAEPATAPTSAPATEPSVIPRPAHIDMGEGSLPFDRGDRIIVDDATRATGEYVADLLAPAMGKRRTVTDNVGDDGWNHGDIVLLIAARPELGDEGYDLIVGKESVLITAAKPAGVFYGVQTLRQLLPPEVESKTKVAGVDWSVPRMTIEDVPRYKWRGLMLDVGRHFRDVAYVKRFLDLMALHKLNTFHWHLTDDQGWRIEIKKYPKLTEIGAWRDDGHGGKYGGFYTQDQIRDVIAYAVARHITIVPEIELPGHSQAAMAAYPDLACTAGPFTVGTKWGIYRDVYCPGKEHTFEFLQDVLSEVAELFPGEFIHIGGDECKKDRWKECPDCQARMKAEGLKTEEELQSYVIRRVSKFLATKGKRVIGWDEIEQGGLAPGAAVMSWHGVKPAIVAARDGHDVVMTPTSNCYFDYYQSKAPGQPKAIGGFLPIEKVYALEPTPSELSPSEAVHVLGAQGNLWSEYLDSERQVDYMAFPRACALAEVCWTPVNQRSFEDFTRRLPQHLRRLDALGVKYFNAPTAP
jgi:hexosaminidase